MGKRLGGADGICARGWVRESQGCCRVGTGTARWPIGNDEFGITHVGKAYDPYSSSA
jgi:hypothetical protein